MIVGPGAGRGFRRPRSDSARRVWCLKSVMVDAVGPVGVKFTREIIGFCRPRAQVRRHRSRLFGVITSGGRVLLDGNDSSGIAAGGDALRRQSGLRRSGGDRSCRTLTFRRTCFSFRRRRPSPVSMLAPGSRSRAALDLGQRLGLSQTIRRCDRTLVSGINRRSWFGVGCTSVRRSMCSRSTAGGRCRRQAGFYRLFDVALQPAPLSWSCRLISRRSPRCATARWCRPRPRCS